VTEPAIVTTSTTTITPTLELLTPTLTLTATAQPEITATLSLTPTSTPGPTPLANNLTARVPILMYHFISKPPANADVYRKDLSVTPENFEEQLAYLKEEGFTSITLDDLLDYLAGRRDSLPEKPIILTFDDGYVDNYTNAFPLLQKYGFVASFALVTQSIDFADPNYMSWENVIEMHQAGMKFASHTYRHPDLRDRDVDFLIYEIIGSKEAIEARINEPIRYFVYPAGQYDQLVIDVLKSADFWAALTIEFGVEQSYSDRFEMPRVRIRGNDTPAQFIAKVNYEE
jgi:peptidoglycan/xylan/chitin deacetylase (PgdA/CDA1 family)